MADEFMQCSCFRWPSKNKVISEKQFDTFHDEWVMPTIAPSLDPPAILMSDQDLLKHAFKSTVSERHMRAKSWISGRQYLDQNFQAQDDLCD